MLLDDRITKQIQDEQQFELDDVRDYLAYDLEMAEVGKQRVYNHFIKNLDHISIKITSFGEDKFVAPEKKSDEVHELPEETFFSVISFTLYEVQRLHNWEKTGKRKPDPNKYHPDDDRKIDEAQRTLGDYKLETGAQYEPQSFETLAYKYHEVLMLRERLHAILSNFNKRVFELRGTKKTTYDFIEEKRWRLKTIHETLPEADRKHLMEINPINTDEEYPEINLLEK
uniref:Uncharacterized protein n=1 Tax=Glossina palpalis gambiensis TaxID=67801 RepID=A0A1B0C0K7_9MUSC